LNSFENWSLAVTGELGYCGRLSTGNDKTSDLVDLFRVTHSNGLSPTGPQGAMVFGKITLQGEHSNFHCTFLYLPSNLALTSRGWPGFQLH
jgi:hypothetical protein